VCLTPDGHTPRVYYLRRRRLSFESEAMRDLATCLFFFFDSSEFDGVALCELCSVLKIPFLFHRPKSIKIFESPRNCVGKLLSHVWFAEISRSIIPKPGVSSPNLHYLGPPNVSAICVLAVV
jgi:hypothetical protein